MVMPRLFSFALPALLAAAAVARPSSAQQSGLPASQQFETRADLEARAKDAEAHHRTSEAWLLRQRLQNGDFQEGDRIILRLQAGTIIKTDTATLRAGKVIQFGGMEDLKLEGVLRSELNDRLTAHIGRYIREPIVKAVPLLRIQISGAVGKPGYYYSSADVLLADVLMGAGGPTPDSDLKKVVIRRGPDMIWTETDTRTALTDGLSLDRLSLRAGDEVFIGRVHKTPWFTIVQVGVTIVTLGLTVMRFR
jgi:hypothetical protein